MFEVKLTPKAKRYYAILIGLLDVGSNYKGAGIGPDYKGKAQRGSSSKK